MSRFSLCILITFFLFSFTGPNGLSQSDTRSFDSSPVNMFTENLGQVKDQNGNPRNDIKYSTEINGLVFHFSSVGVAYQQWAVTSSTKQYLGVIEGDSDFISIPDSVTIFRTDIEWQDINEEVEITTGNRIAGSQKFINPNSDNEILVNGYDEIRYNEIYSGIDLRWYFQNNEIEYDFVVNPGVDYSKIKWKISGADSIFINGEGDLVIKTAMGEIVENAPISFQDGKCIATKWVVNKDVVGFEVFNYDPNKELIIDPVIRKWGSYYGGGSYDYVWDSEIDGNGNVYITGSTLSTTAIASSGAHKVTTNYSWDGYLAKFNSNGTRQWGTFYGGSNMEIPRGIAVSSNNQIVVVGETRSPDGISTTGAHKSVKGIGTGAIGADGFIIKFNDSGTRLWGTYYGGDSIDFFHSCSIDTNDNIIAVGITQSITGVSTSGSFQTANGGQKDGMVVKLNSAGTRIWGSYFGGSNNEELYDCGVDSLNNISYSGYSTSSSGVATVGAYQTVLGSGGRNAVLGRIRPNGSLHWSTYFGSFGWGYSRGCAVGANGDIFLTGHTYANTLAISTWGTHQSFVGGGYDSYLVKFDSLGNRVWGTYFGGSLNDIGQRCKLRNGTIVFVGRTISSNLIAFSNGYQNNKSGDYDAFIVAFDTTGNRLWSTYFGSTLRDEANGCSIDNLGNVYVSGFTHSTGLSSSGSHQSNYGGGTTDGFLAKFYYCENDSSDTTIIVCNKYTSPISGNEWTVSGTYFDTISRVQDCDSIVQYNLTINHSPTSNISVSTCYEYSGVSGTHNWTTSGIYHDTIPIPNSCDLIMIIDLTILQPQFNVIYDTVCNSRMSPSGRYQWTNSGLYIDSIPASNGCDSIMVYHLEVLQPTTPPIDTTVCIGMISPSGLHFWDSSRVYFDTINLPNGCDSVMGFNLTVVPIELTHLNVASCGVYISPSGNQYFSSGVYQDTLSNIYGCDSILNITVSIGQPSIDSISWNECGAVYSPSGNHYWESSGTYSDTLISQYGCDSIIYVELDITHINTQVTFDNFDLVSNELNANYQWIDCDSNIYLPGETNRVFSVTRSGSFAVELTKNNCIDTSDCYNYTSVGTQVLSSNPTILYPSPNGGEFKIKMGSALNNGLITIYSSNGSVVHSQKVSGIQIVNFDLEVSSGIYTVQISSEERVERLRLVIK